MAVNKPSNLSSKMWASAGTVEMPSDAKIASGWTVEVPKFQTENWVQGRNDQAIGHINERGIAEWDATTDYIAGKSYVQGSNGKVYLSKVDSGPSSSVQNPVTDTSKTKWDEAFAGKDGVVFKTGENGAAILPTGTTAQRPTPAEGLLRLNTDTGQIEGHQAGRWGDINITSKELFSGDNLTKEFQLNSSPASKDLLQVYISGVYQQKNTYELGGLSGDLLIFEGTPPTGTDNIEVVVSSLIPSDDRLRGELGGGVRRFDSVASMLAAAARFDGDAALVVGYHAGSHLGGGVFRWDASKSKGDHDGGTVIDPTKVFPVDWVTGAAAWFVASNVGTGCFVRITEGPLRPEHFGAFGDGVSDDKHAMARMFSVSEGKHVVISRHHRTSVIDEWTGGFELKSHSTVRFVGAGKISLLPHHSQRYGLLSLQDVTDVTIYDPRLDGRKDLNTHTTGEWGTGIQLKGARGRIVIHNPVTVNMWGDGISLENSTTNAYCEDVTINDHVADGCRRQGVSITSAKHVRINDPVWKNIGGTLPSAGLDLEPNFNTDILEDIEVNYPQTENCAGPGILVFLQNIVGTIPKHIGIVVRGHKDTGSQSGATLQALNTPTGSGAVTGEILFDHPKYVQSALSGITVASWQHTALLTRFVRPTIIDWNASGYAIADYGSAISIINDVGSQIEPSAYIGNIEITDRVYIDNVGLGRGNDYVINKVGGLVRDVRLLEFGEDAPIKASEYSNSGISITDRGRHYRQILNENTNLSHNTFPTLLNRVDYPATPAYTLPTNVDADFNKEITLVNALPGDPAIDFGQTGAMIVRPPAGGHFLGQAENAGFKCSFYEGNEITVAHVRANTWRVVSSSGLWTVIA